MESIDSFDVREMLAGFHADPEAFVSMAKRVKAEIPHHLGTLREALAERRLRGVEYAARCIGMLLDSLLAGPAAAAARDLETASRRLDRFEAERAFESLEDELEEYLQDLQDVLHSAADIRPDYS